MLLYKNGEMLTLISITVTLDMLVTIFLHIRTIIYKYVITVCFSTIKYQTEGLKDIPELKTRTAGAD